jgi:hypothetical protein
MPRSLVGPSPAIRRRVRQLARYGLGACLGALLAAPQARAQAAAGHTAPHRIAALTVPGKPLTSFDVSVVDGHVYALADRSNAGVDLFRATDGHFIGRASGFTGKPAHGAHNSGPNGLAAVGSGQIWAGDGDSTVKVVDLRTHAVIDTIATGGSQRVDELTYDPRDHLVVAMNNADDPPFATFISTTGISTTGHHRVVGRLPLPQATGGLEQPVWDAASGHVYLAIPELDGHPAQGAIAEIDPRTRTLLRMLPVARCMPAGLAMGAHQQVLVGCSDDAVSAGFPATSMILRLPQGTVERVVTHVGGSDEVWFDAVRNAWYLAAVANPGGPVLGMIDGRSGRWEANVPTGPHAHSVAADGSLGKVFVPIAAAGREARCPDGCIAVFAAGR